MSRLPSVQTAHLGIESIDEGVLHLAGGQLRAILEVSSVNFGLKDELEQEAIVAGYAAFLNSLSYPVQLLVRVAAIDIEAYLADLERRLPYAGLDRGSELGLDHIAFLRRLAQRRTLLERRFFFLLPRPPPRPPRRQILPGWVWPRPCAGRGGGGAPGG